MVARDVSARGRRRVSVEGRVGDVSRVVVVWHGRMDWRVARKSMGEEGSWNCDWDCSLLDLMWSISWTRAKDVWKELLPLPTSTLPDRRFWEMVSASSVNTARVPLGVNSRGVSRVIFEIAVFRDDSSRVTSISSELGWCASDGEDDDDGGGGGGGA